MWLFTLQGFYSIVTAEEFGHALQVRARSEDDINRLRESFPKLGPNVRVSGRDYPVRAFTTHADLAECMSKLAQAIDYDNFKSEVALRQGRGRADIYSSVWSDCLEIEHEEFAGEAVNTEHSDDQRHSAVRDATTSGHIRTNEYRIRDLVAEGIWKQSDKPRYGTVVFDAHRRVLLREPSNHFDGYYWTFAKGRAEPGEHPIDAALRETLEESGHKPEIVGHIPDAFPGGNTGSSNFYYLAYDTEGQVDRSIMDENGETTALQWASLEESRDLISKSTNVNGRKRDLEVLEAAFREYQRRG